MGEDLKPSIVLSGVNFTEMGPLTVLKDAIESLAKKYPDRYNIIALVHRKSLFDIPGVTFLEYPMIKSSWWRRLRFEYYECLAISKEIKPYLWLSMHDMTPNVRADVKAVYCHNPSPFYPFSFHEACLDWKFGLFNLLYRFLYRINIESNDFVVVQQDWLRREFQSRYGVSNVVVAHPSVDNIPRWGGGGQEDSSKPYRFFYPAYPRVFKNIEQVLRASRRLEESGFDRFELWLTMDGSETPYAAMMRKEYADLSTVRWMGLQPRTEVFRLYGEADCLLFPSKLETWGIPITEFKTTGKPILVADLPYAHETVGEYGKVAFFLAGDDVKLAATMEQAANRLVVFSSQLAQPIAEPFSRNWEDLWNILLENPEVGMQHGIR
jgi:glycosyltransferase involved in cell wall biosynthesis